MPRIKRGTIAKKKHRKIKKLTKGYLHSRHASVRRGREAVIKAGQHSYFDRKKKKSSFRRLWNIKISAGLTGSDLSYSKFIHLLRTKKIVLNKKILAQLAETDKKTFDKIVEEVKK